MKHIFSNVFSNPAGVAFTSAGASGNAYKKQYVPTIGESVIGTVVEVNADHLVVNIGGKMCALLPKLCFEGATEHNSVCFGKGALVHARICNITSKGAPMLSCICDSGRGCGLGLLEGGCTFCCGTTLAQRLLRQSHNSALKNLGRIVSFEVVVGLNGYAWVSAVSSCECARVARCLLR